MLFAMAPRSCISIICADAVNLSEVHELRLTQATLVHKLEGRLSQTNSESESSRRTPGQTCVTVSDPVLDSMRQACNYQGANLG